MPRFHRGRCSIHRQGNRVHEPTMTFEPPSHSMNIAAMYLWDQPIGQHDQRPPLCTCCTGLVDSKLHRQCFSRECLVHSAFQKRLPHRCSPTAATIGGKSPCAGWLSVGEYEPPLYAVWLVRVSLFLPSTCAAVLLPGLARLSGRNADWLLSLHSSHIHPNHAFTHR